MRLLVTGGSGFIGTNLVQHCIQEGIDVLNLDSRPPPMASHATVWRQTDILERRTVTSAFREFEPHFVVHLAARTDLKEKRRLGGYEANFDGTENVVQACGTAGSVARLLIVSSMLVCRYGYIPLHDRDYAPDTLYGRSKVLAEEVVRNSSALQSKWVIARPTSVWGPWFGPPYMEFFLTIHRGRFRHAGKASVPKPFVYVGNAVFQLMRLLEAPEPLIHRKTFYLVDDPGYTIREWAEVIRQEMGGKPIGSVPIWGLKTAALVGDIAAKTVWVNPPLTTFRLRNMLTPYAVDGRTIAEVTGACPFTLAQGVRMTTEWLQKQGLI